ncbi:hypothetical protein Taro_042103, partial [Colocasia esculenta]|nr:hypothetical protein [Colocasia esculenta]
MKVVATVAFGMGLDKSDVGAETGRAGRDGRLSCCYLLLDESIYYKLRSLLHRYLHFLSCFILVFLNVITQVRLYVSSDGVDEYALNRLLSQIFDNKDLPGKIYSLVKESASRKFDMKEEVLLTVLTQLELGEVQYLCLLPQTNVTCTLQFHKTSPDLLSDKNILISAILKKAETKHGQYIFDIPTVANCIGTTTIELLNQLQKLKVWMVNFLIISWTKDTQSLGEVTYDTKDPSLCYTITSAPGDIVSLSTDLTKWLSEVERCKYLRFFHYCKQISKLDAMFHAATFAAKECKGISGCSYSLHTGCMQKRIVDYFGKGNNACEHAFPTKGGDNSPFLRADIKVRCYATSYDVNLRNSNLHVKFTPRAVARIMHGIPSPAFPSAAWSKSHFWGRYSQVDFPVVMKAATVELMNMKGERGSV